jgi:5-formyltetrahydrofolate cyclo-ligase
MYAYMPPQTLKSILRDTYHDIRNGLSEDYQKKSSLKICTNIQKLDPYRYAKRIGLYHAFKREVDLDALWQKAPRQGKFCYFPILNEDQTLAFLPATPATSFQKNQYGILEPVVDRGMAIPISELQVVMVPLVVFDKEGTRIGMGGGYYDRSLGEVEKLPFLIGVAYEFQRHPRIEADAWDVPLDVIITEKTIYWREKGL